MSIIWIIIKMKLIFSTSTLNLSIKEMPKMSVSESDPRSIRTRDSLRDALIKLAAENAYDSLCIKDITNEAGLNRTTFYLHYSGLHELLNDCAHMLFEQMRTEIYTNKADPSKNSPASLIPFVQSVFKHLEQYEKFYRAMLGKFGDPLFRELFQELLSELIFEPMTTQKINYSSNPRLEMNLHFFCAGFTGIAVWWLENDKPMSAQEASRYITSDILPDYLRLMSV